VFRRWRAVREGRVREGGRGLRRERGEEVGEVEVDVRREVAAGAMRRLRRVKGVSGALRMRSGMPVGAEGSVRPTLTWENVETRESG
jgi:hypothetical protein